MAFDPVEVRTEALRTYAGRKALSAHIDRVLADAGPTATKDFLLREIQLRLGAERKKDSLDSVRLKYPEVAELLEDLGVI